MSYLSSKPMRYLSKSPWLRSLIVTSNLSALYFYDWAKLQYYAYRPPSRPLKPEYRKDSPIPRYEIDSKQRPDPYEEVLIPLRTIEKVFHGQVKTLHLLRQDHLKRHDVYGEFQFNHEDLHCRSRDLIDRLLNGAFPIDLSPNPKNPHILERSIRFSEFDSGNRCQLPDVTLRLRRGDKRLDFEEIVIVDRKLGRHVYRPDSPFDQWTMAQQILLGVWNYYGELYDHVVHTHVEMEQYAIALNRNLNSSNPLYKLLFPHLVGLGAVNAMADKTLIGKNGILTARGLLSHQEVEKFILSHLKKISWKSWTPIKPLGAYHRYAELGQLFWKLLTEFLDEYFETCQEALTHYLPEIQAFSDDLVQHAPLENSRDKTDLTLVGVNLEETIANLKVLCRHILFKVTFWHSWVHVERGDTPVPYRQKFFRKPSDYWHFQERQDSLRSLVIQLALEYSSVNVVRSYNQNFYPSILKGEDSYGVSDLLKTKLEKYRESFRQRGFNVDFIMSRMS